MASVTASNVLIGTPDQSTTGAIYDAPTGTAAPTKASDTLNSAFTSSGYVSEDGVTLTPDYSTNDIKDWSGALVRRMLDSFTGEISWSELEMSYEAMCHAFGSDNVVKTAATSTTGTQLKVSIGQHLPPVRSWCFKMKDGDARILIYVPRGQVTGVDSMSFNKSDAISIPITLSCLADDSGNSIYIFTDDGVTTK